MRAIFIVLLTLYSSFVFASSQDVFELGRSLFFDKILSGNKNISCATCHHPRTGTSDALSLGVGEGGVGVGLDRTTGSGKDAILQRVPRNSPALFNLGLSQHPFLFHDGRLFFSSREPSGFQSPAGKDLPRGLNSILSAQALFPMTSDTEMAGQPGENDIADALEKDGVVGVWRVVLARVQNIPKYVSLFKQAYSHIDKKEDISIVDLANSIGFFEAEAFRALGSPYDDYLKGGSLTTNQLAGLKIFNGKGKCSSCHSGVLQTDFQFHAIGVPPLGPGKGDGEWKLDDFGFARVTGKLEDRYKFRTPSLRNVMLTGPWGHNGAFASMKDMIVHHLDPKTSLFSYQSSQGTLPFRADLNLIDSLLNLNILALEEIASYIEILNVELSDQEVDQLIEFLHSLTDPRSKNLTRLIPRSVPSGLPVDK